MSVKQLKWILNKALFLVYAYEGRELTEKDCQDIIGYAREAYEDSKGDGRCKDIMLEVLAAFDQAAQKKEGT